MKAELVLGNLKREREALNGKLERLENALNKEWQDADQEYLCNQQYNAMSLYAHILDERIIDIEYKLAMKKAKDETVDEHETCHCDKNIFKEEIDPESYRKYVKKNISDDKGPDDVVNIVIGLINDVFGENLI